MTKWLTDKLIDWLIEKLTEKLIEKLIDSQKARLLTEKQIEWQTD